jgi:hypothetical protein
MERTRYTIQQIAKINKEKLLNLPEEDRLQAARTLITAIIESTSVQPQPKEKKIARRVT